MANIEVKKENKLKKFWEDHAPEIIAIGSAALAVTLVGIVTYKRPGVWSAK